MDENNFPIASREELITAINNAQQKTSYTIFNKTLSSINVNLVESLTGNIKKYKASDDETQMFKNILDKCLMDAKNGSYNKKEFKIGDLFALYVKKSFMKRLMKAQILLRI